MGGGHLVDQEPVDGRPYHFQRSWINHDLRADPANLRIMHVEGDSMMPTLHDGDIVLVDLGRRAPTPPGIFVLHDGMGLVAKRLEHIPNSDPPRERIISDNPLYKPYEGSGEEVNSSDGSVGSRGKVTNAMALGVQIVCGITWSRKS